MNQQLFIERIEMALRAPAGTVKDTSILKELDGWDSIGLLTVIAVVDEHYGVTLDARGLFKCNTVEDLIRLVDRNS
jgi:acyl carrier protein